MTDKAKQFLRSDKLVGLLRQQDYYNKAHYVSDQLYGQAADCIERLTKALTRISNLSPAVTHGWAEEARQIARAALAGDSHDQ